MLKTSLRARRTQCWAGPGPSWVGLGLLLRALGRLLASLGRLWGCLGRILNPLGHVYGASWVLFCARTPPSIDFWEVWDCAGLSFGELRGHLLRCVFISAVTTLLSFPAMFYLAFWCGGLCAALGIKFFCIFVKLVLHMGVS